MPELVRPVTVGCAVIDGVDAIPVTIEVTLGADTGSPRILGQVDSVVREAYHRIFSAFRADGLPTPRGIPTINFTPAHVRKTGSAFDLPMALAIAGAAGLFPVERTAGLTAWGEISLRGTVLPVRGAVSAAVSSARNDAPVVMASPDDAAYAAMVPGVRSVPVTSLREALEWLRGDREIEPACPPSPPARPPVREVADIRGHDTPKQALLVAAAGWHNLLFSGPPGSGKTALLRRLPDLLPPTGEDEALEILKIHTLRSNAPPPRPPHRPMRAPHHSSSHVSLLGGGPDPRPGEVTLAHHGVLFLDELAEFRREALEGLRQPLEEGRIEIARASRCVTMPADCLLVAAMNPCPCGYHAHPSRACRCSRAQRLRYAGRVSGPLLDRFDLLLEVPALPPEVLSGPPSDRYGTAEMHERVVAAVARQKARGGRRYVPNGRLADSALDAAIGTDSEVRVVVDEVIRTLGLSGRARVRLLRVARTIADLGDREFVDRNDILQAARLRTLEASGWRA